MLFVYLRLLYLALRDFFVPQPKHAHAFVKPLDVNEQCPYCGHRDGSIQAKPDMALKKWRVFHACKVCGGSWPVDTVAERPIEA